MPEPEKRSRLVGLLALAASVLLFLILVVLFASAGGLAKIAMGGDGFAAWVAYAVVGFSAAFLATLLSFYRARLRSYGRRHLAPDAASVLHRDTRQPVLYLRPFAVDAIAAIPRFRFGAPVLSSAKTEEEELADALVAIGPVVTIGEPGEWAPHLGAARMYLPDDWQRTVLHLMRTASLVVLGAGYSENFMWELRQAIAIRPPTSILLIIPFDPAQYARFREHVQPLFPRPLPDYPPGKATVDWSIKGAVFFDAYWTSSFVRFDQIPRPGGRRSSLAWSIVRSLRPVFERYGPTLREPPAAGRPRRRFRRLRRHSTPWR